MKTDGIFEMLQRRDIRQERRIFWRELAVILVVALLVTTYLVALWLTVGRPSRAAVSSMTSPFAIGRAVSAAL